MHAYVIGRQQSYNIAPGVSSSRKRRAGVLPGNYSVCWVILVYHMLCTYVSISIVHTYLSIRLSSRNVRKHIVHLVCLSVIGFSFRRRSDMYYMYMSWLHTYILAMSSGCSVVWCGVGCIGYVGVVGRWMSCVEVGLSIGV